MSDDLGKVLEIAENNQIQILPSSEGQHQETAGRMGGK
jgi:hypothetical protein